ncbi:MAG: aa3-type cytochrome c oxidase subunit IV [Pseudomonadota bacterium]
MGNKPENIEVDPQAIEDSKKLWVVFTEATKYTIIAIVIVLALMALFLL